MGIEAQNEGAQNHGAQNDGTHANAEPAAETASLRRSHALAAAFRAIMDAVAQPGAIQHAPRIDAPLPPLSPAAATVILTLVDETAPLWLAPPLASAPRLRDALRFSLGGALIDQPEDAAFLLGDWESLAPVLPEARRGTPERPDLSATAIIEVASLSAARPPSGTASGAALTGPGVPPQAPRTLWIGGDCDGLWTFQAGNRARFPLGIDFLFTAGERIAAAPRRIAATPL
ncbi:MAG: phosphonate C-P lyase system protein PhnH [Pseudomonadota bacterium]